MLKSCKDFYISTRFDRNNVVISMITKILKEQSEYDKCYFDIAWFNKYNRIKFYNVDDIHFISLSDVYMIILRFNNGTKETINVKKLETMTYHEYIINKSIN